MKKIGAEVRTESMSCVIFLNLNALLSFRDWYGRSLEVWKTEYILGSTHVFPLWTRAWCWRGGSWIGQRVMYGTVIVPVPANTRHSPNAVFNAGRFHLCHRCSWTLDIMSYGVKGRGKRLLFEMYATKYQSRSRSDNKSLLLYSQVPRDTVTAPVM